MSPVSRAKVNWLVACHHLGKFRKIQTRSMLESFHRLQHLGIWHALIFLNLCRLDDSFFRLNSLKTISILQKIINYYSYINHHSYMKLYITRASVVPVQSPIMTKNQYISLGSIYIIDISIYLDLPREEQTDRCTDCQLKD